MDGAVSEVDELFRVAESEAGVGDGAFVSSICGSDGVSLPNGARHEVIPEASGEATVADRHEPVIPAGDGHPDFELDDRVGNRRDCAGDAAERGQMVEWTTGSAIVDRRKITLFNAGDGDGGVGEFETGETFADFSVG